LDVFLSAISDGIYLYEYSKTVYVFFKSYLQIHNKTLKKVK